MKASDLIGKKLLFVVNPDPIHVGAHLIRAARSLEIDFRVCDIEEAFRGSWWLRKLNWHLRDHRPTRIRTFNESVLRTCDEFRPHWIVVTGLTALTADTLDAIQTRGIYRLNFLTDDPWNVAHQTNWGLKSLLSYDVLFTPRRANLNQLRLLGKAKVDYLPFGYDPHSHFIEPASASERSGFASQLLFAGAADADRLPYARAAIAAELDVRLYGISWKKFSDIRPYAKGQVGTEVLRRAVRETKVNLCLVRRANRDGHSMRTFEIPAMGGALLAEDTEEHREILGASNDTVVYFSSPEEMAEKARWLLAHETQRKRQSEALYRRITHGPNTYRDRLLTMLHASSS